MFVTEIKIMKRKNLGNYEHKEATISVALKEGDSVEESVGVAENLVESILNGERPAVKAPKTSEKTADVPPPIPQDAGKEAEKPKAKTSKAKASAAQAPSDEDLKEKLRDLTKKLKDRAAVNDLITQACGEVKAVADMTDKEKISLMKFVEKAL